MNLRRSGSIDSANKRQRIIIQESSAILSTDHISNEQLKTPAQMRKETANPQTMPSNDKGQQCVNEDPQISRSCDANDINSSTRRMSLQAWNFGKPTFEYLYRGSLLWYEERVKKSQRKSCPTFSICCEEGNVRLPPIQPPPEFLRELLSHEGGLDHQNFKKTLELITPFLHLHRWGQM